MASNNSVSARSKAGHDSAQTGLRGIGKQFDIDDPVWAEVCDRLRFAAFPAQAVLAREGEILEKYILVLKGTVRCEKSASNGRQIYVSRAGNGQSCALAATSLINGTPLMADSIAETDVLIGLMAGKDFGLCMNDSPGFRRYVFSGYSEQMANIMALLKDLAFHRVDERLAQLLLSREQPVIRKTHQDLANELGTAREVISRTIKTFREYGWVDVQRGTLEVVDRDALSELVPKHVT